MRPLYSYQEFFQIIWNYDQKQMCIIQASISARNSPAWTERPFQRLAKRLMNTAQGNSDPEQQWSSEPLENMTGSRISRNSKFIFLLENLSHGPTSLY